MATNNQDTPIDLQTILVGNESIPIAHLYQLSDLTPENLEIFSSIWSQLDDERRRIIIRHMVDITEEVFHVDYDDIFAYCLGDPSPLVRIASLDGLWNSERIALIKPIMDVAHNDPDMEVRRLAAATLGHYVILGEWDVIPLKQTEPIIEGLLAILEDGDSNPEVKRAALESIASATHAKVAGLIEQAYDSGDSRMQVSAIFSMGQSADPRWLPIIQDEMQSPYEDMRIEAARAAGAIGKSDALSDVADLIMDDDLEVRLAAIAALGEIGTDLGREILMDLADDPYLEDLHPAVEEALDEMSWMDIGFDFDRIDWENDSDDISYPET